MRKVRISYIVAAGLLLAMCGTQTRPVKSFSSSYGDVEMPLSSLASYMGYEKGMEPLFYYTEGIKASLLYGDPELAAGMFERAIELDSAYSPSYFAAANNIAPFDPVAALGYSARANELDSTNIWYQAQLGHLMIYNGDFESALGTYTRLTKTSPNDPDNYRMLAALYEYTGQPFTAIAMLDSAEYKFGKLEELVEFKRELLMKVSYFDKAIAESEELIRDYPYKYENYLILGDIYSATGKDSLAMDNYRKALELNPEGVDILIAINDHYKSMNDNANFLSTARQIISHDDMDVDTKIKFIKDLIQNKDYYVNNYFGIGSLITALFLKYPENDDVIDMYATNLISGGSVEDGLNIYKGYVGKAQDKMKFFRYILELEAYLERPDSVDKYTEQALEYFPDNTDLFMRRGYAMQHMERSEDALDAYNNALRYIQNDTLKSSILGTIGDMFHQAGDKKKSYSYYDRALKLNPDNVVVLNNYAYFLSDDGENLGKALKMSEKVVKELEPGNPTYIDTYAWVLYKLGRYEEAKTAIQQAVTFDHTGSEELFIHYGDILYELGDSFMAQHYWQKALDAGYDKEEIEKRFEKIESRK